MFGHKLVRSIYELKSFIFSCRDICHLSESGSIRMAEGVSQFGDGGDMVKLLVREERQDMVPCLVAMGDSFDCMFNCM